MVGRLVSFSDGLCSEDMLVLGSVVDALLVAATLIFLAAGFLSDLIIPFKLSIPRLND